MKLAILTLTTVIWPVLAQPAQVNRISQQQLTQKQWACVSSGTQSWVLYWPNGVMEVNSVKEKYSLRYTLAGNQIRYSNGTTETISFTGSRVTIGNKTCEESDNNPEARKAADDFKAQLTDKWYCSVTKPLLTGVLDSYFVTFRPDNTYLLENRAGVFTGYYRAPGSGMSITRPDGRIGYGSTNLQENRLEFFDLSGGRETCNRSKDSLRLKSQSNMDRLSTMESILTQTNLWYCEDSNMSNPRDSYLENMRSDHTYHISSRFGEFDGFFEVVGDRYTVTTEGKKYASKVSFNNNQLAFTKGNSTTTCVPRG